MHEIVVIGAGQLGSRHLQGLAPLHAQARLHMVDPTPAAIEQSRARVAEIAGAEVAAAVVAHADAGTLPERIDVAIVATTADRRFAAVSALLERTRVRYLVLEKVLFQKAAEFAATQALLERCGTQAWVNCPRRAYPIYHTVREWLAGDPLLDLEVAGGDWGLGCNGIHFVDLFAFLSARAPASYDTSGLEHGVREARRKGYIEFSGTLRASIDGADLALTSRHGSALRHLVTVRSRAQCIVLDEAGGKLWRWRETGEPELASFAAPYQSQLTGAVARQILDDGTSALTPFAESARLHLPFLAALAAHDSGSAGVCRIT